MAGRESVGLCNCPGPHTCCVNDADCQAVASLVRLTEAQKRADDELDELLRPVKELIASTLGKHSADAKAAEELLAEMQAKLDQKENELVAAKRDLYVSERAMLSYRDEGMELRQQRDAERSSKERLYLFSVFLGFASLFGWSCWIAELVTR